MARLWELSHIMMMMFAKIARIAWVSALSMPGEQPTVLHFFGLPIHEQLQDCKGMLPIGTPCKPMLQNLNCWGLPGLANLRGMRASHCKPVL